MELTVLAVPDCPRCAGCWNKPVHEVCRRRL